MTEIDVAIQGSRENPVLVVVDAAEMAQIIAHFTKAREPACIRAANAICDYLAQVHRKANAEHQT